jgi:hypothetical protein
MIGIESIAALLKWRVLRDNIFLDLNSTTCSPLMLKEGKLRDWPASMLVFVLSNVIHFFLATFYCPPLLDMKPSSPEEEYPYSSEPRLPSSSPVSPDPIS